MGQLRRHRHRAAYAALVVEGAYEEAGDRGRFEAEPGVVLVHDGFEGHRDVVTRGGARVVNLPLLPGHALPAAFRVRGFEALRCAALESPAEVAQWLEPEVTVAPLLRDWPDLLAASLRHDPNLRLSTWAREAGIHPGSLSRGFAAAFGTTPARFRAELRARAAWAALGRAPEPLAELACAHGFADQAHLTRAVRALTGSPPSAWRPAKVKLIQYVGPGLR